MLMKGGGQLRMYMYFDVKIPSNPIKIGSPVITAELVVAAVAPLHWQLHLQQQEAHLLR